jgi:phosphonate degradation associated HDIG domain protein
MDIVNRITALFETRGDAAYFGEPVSQTEHALQTAFQAEAEGLADALVVVALLHDVGHLVHRLPEDIADVGTDARHEDVAAQWLRQHFGPEVAEPIRLHVAAKRYLCAVEPTYAEQLSPASRQSLELQGGPFNATQIDDFHKQPFWQDAVRLRRWDDLAKIPDLKVPSLEHYRLRLEAAARRNDLLNTGGLRP